MAKEEKRQCWYKEGQTCKCEKGSDCIELRMEHSKLVYCNDSGCAFNQELPDKVKIDRGMARTPLIEDTDYATGVCTRTKGVFLAFRKYLDKDLKTVKKETRCLVRSDRKFDRVPIVWPDEQGWESYDDTDMWV